MPSDDLYRDRLFRVRLYLFGALSTLLILAVGEKLLKDAPTTAALPDGIGGIVYESDGELKTALTMPTVDLFPYESWRFHFAVKPTKNLSYWSERIRVITLAQPRIFHALPDQRYWDTTTGDASQAPQRERLVRTVVQPALVKEARSNLGIAIVIGEGRVLVTSWRFVGGCALVIASTLALLALAWSAVIQRRRAARKRRACCPHCGYARTGIPPDAPCPECGQYNTSA